MKKKLIGLLLVSAMTLASLTGCGASVTAESLIDDAFEDIEYAEYDMSMSVQMAISESGISMDMGIKADLGIEATEKTAHIEGVMEVTVFGMSVEQETENYQVVDGDTMTTYTYDPDYEEWTYAETEVDKDNDNLLPVIKSDMFEELELEETDDGYEVTGVLADTDELFGLQDETVNALAEGLAEVDILVTFTFNEDKEIESYEVTFEVDEEETYEIEDMGEVSISEFVIKMEFKSFKGDEIEVPEKVIEEAVEEGDYDFDYDFDYDEDTEYEDTEETKEDWGNGEISYNIPEDGMAFELDGVTYTFGSFTYQDFVDSTGLVLDEDFFETEEDYILSAGDYDIVFLDDEDYNYVTLYLKNNTEEDMNIFECDVVGFSFDPGQDSGYSLSIAGVSVGASLDEIVEKLGTPYSTYAGYGYEMLYYYLNDEFSSCITIYYDEDYGMTGFDIYKQLY